MKVEVSENNRQQGSIILITLLILAVLTLSSLMAMNMAGRDSSIMRNSRAYLCDLYRAETGITLAQENHEDSWLAPDSDLFDLSQADAAVRIEDFSIPGENGDNMSPMGRYAIARIETAPDPGALSETFYPLGHRAPMPAGSGYSGMKFEIRRYGILSTGYSRPVKPGAGVTVEAGLYKIFNRFDG